MRTDFLGRMEVSGPYSVWVVILWVASEEGGVDGTRVTVHNGTGCPAKTWHTFLCLSAFFTAI